MKIHQLVSYLICMIFFSCAKEGDYQKSHLINYKDFKSTQKIKGSNLQFDSVSLRPTSIQVFDSLLFTVNRKDEKLIHVFNLNTKKKIGERIAMGGGPGEMLQPYFVSVDSQWVQLFDMSTFTLYVYDTRDFVINPSPAVNRKIKLSEPVLGDARLLGSNIITSSYNPNNQFSLFDSNGNSPLKFGTYPISNVPFSDKEKLEAYRFSFTTNQKDKVAVCYNWTDLIDILDKKGHLLKRIYGPQHFISIFKESHDGNVVSAAPVQEKTRDAYFSPVNAGDDFFVLFSGKAEGEENYDILANQIFVFDWNGEPKKILSLDQGVFCITVDPKNKRIYGISDQPEFHIVAFSYN